MNEKYAALRANVGMLGQLLGKSIKDHQGQAFLDKIETLRGLLLGTEIGPDPSTTSEIFRLPLRTPLAIPMPITAITSIPRTILTQSFTPTCPSSHGSPRGGVFHI